MEAGSISIQPKPAAPDPAARSVNTIMARLINVAVTALKADSVEKSANLIVNQIHNIVKTDRAIVVPMKGRKRMLSISGNLEVSQDNAFSQAVQEIRAGMRGVTEARTITRTNFPKDVDAPNAKNITEAMNGTNILWLPVPYGAADGKGHALWLERWNNRPWTEEEIKILGHAAVFFGHALNKRKKAHTSGMGKIFLGLALIVFILLMFLPIQSRINAPVQVVPDKPHYVFAPFNGIVEELFVQPGQTVKKGDLIFRYDTRVLEKELDEGLRAIAVAKAELVRLEGAAYRDEDARSKIPVQKLEIERKEAEVAFIRKQLELAEVRSGSDGVVVLDDPDALIGASLQTGQLVLSIADPEKTKLKVMVPVSDAGLLRDSAFMDVRLDSDPLKTIPAEIKRIGFDVKISDDRVPSIYVEGNWKEKTGAGPGQRGIVRIEGPTTRLGLQLFRKPLMTLRTILGI